MGEDKKSLEKTQLIALAAAVLGILMIGAGFILTIPSRDERGELSGVALAFLGAFITAIAFVVERIVSGLLDRLEAEERGVARERSRLLNPAAASANEESQGVRYGAVESTFQPTDKPEHKHTRRNSM